MDHLIGAALTFGYLAMFLFVISRMKFFRIGNIPIQWFQGVFVLKVISGFLLYLVYTYYYTDRSTTDIWKYYDDGLIMFSALKEHPLDYVKMLFAVGNDTPYFEQYYDRMNHWYRPYGSSIANDTHTIIRFNAFVRLFSLGHYNVHSVVVNFLGLIGLTGILHFLKQMAPKKEKWFFAGVFLMPGMMFWASGVLKEPLLLFGLGLFLFSVFKIVEEKISIGKVALVLLSLFFLFTVKSYALIAIVPGLIAWLICLRVKQVHPAFIFSGAYVLLGVAVIIVGMLMPDKNPIERLAKKQHEFYQLAEGGTYIETAEKDTLYIGAENYEALDFISDRQKIVLTRGVDAVYWKEEKLPKALVQTLNEGNEFNVLLDYGKTGSTIDIPRLEPTAWSIMNAIPVAFINATFRPFPQHVNSPFMALSALENIMVVILFFLAVILFQAKVLGHPVFYVAVMFALVILVLTGLVTPVVGAIVRYKVPALPFLACGLLALINTSKIEEVFIKRLPFLKKYF